MAQPKTIGARLGYNFELSYQHQTENGMVEIDAGYSPFITQKGVFIDEDGDLNVRKYRYECLRFQLVRRNRCRGYLGNRRFFRLATL